MKIQPDLAEAQSNLGYVLAREGRIGEAIKQYEELLRIEPANPEARQALTWLRALPPGGRQPEKQSGQPRRIGLSCCSFAAPSCSSPPPCAS